MPYYAYLSLNKEERRTYLEDNKKKEVLEDSELNGIEYLVVYKQYSKSYQRSTGRAGNLFLYINKKEKIKIFWHGAERRTKWIEYGEREWPRMKTIPQEIKDRVKEFEGFINLRNKLIKT